MKRSSFDLRSGVRGYAVPKRGRRNRSNTGVHRNGGTLTETGGAETRPLPR